MNYNMRYTAERDRETALNYLRELKKNKPNARIIDIGGNHSTWAGNYATHYVDLFKVPGAVTFQGNMNMFHVWQEVWKDVEKNGKFDFAICTHTLEDICNPAMPLFMMDQIALEGYIATPSKYAEMTTNIHAFRGSIHHRWIFNNEDNVFTIYPKVNYVEREPKFDKICYPTWDAMLADKKDEIQFFWKDSIDYKFMNDDYMGPSDDAVFKYYDGLLNDQVKN